MKTQSVKNSEEYKVKFWFKNDQGFHKQQTKSYYFSNKNSHIKAIKECKNEFPNITIVNCVYQ